MEGEQIWKENNNGFSTAGGLDWAQHSRTDQQRQTELEYVLNDDF